MLTTQILTNLSGTDLREKDNFSEFVGFLIVEGKKHEIKRGDTKIGRDPSVCSIFLDNLTVSKIHSVIESEGKDDTFIYDVGSTNSTKLGKKILKPHYRYKLENGNVITLGNVIATVDFTSEVEKTPVGLVAEVEKNSIKSSTEVTAFKLGGLVTNYNQSIIGNIFDLETQVSQVSNKTEVQPCTSTVLLKSATSEKLQYSKNSNISLLSKEDDICAMNHSNYFKNANQINLKSQMKHVLYSTLEDSNIFNMMTQEQIYSSKINPLNTNNTNCISTQDKQNIKVESLLDDGQDEIFCNFENLKFLNKENTSTPLKIECAPSTSKNDENLSKNKLVVPKSLQNDLEIDREIDLIKNDVEINRSFDEDFFCYAVDSVKVIKKSDIQKNKCDTSIKLSENLNTSELKNININITNGKERNNFTRNRKSSDNFDEKNMSQLTLNNFESYKSNSPSKTKSPSYLDNTISDEQEPNINDNKYDLNKSFPSISLHSNKLNKCNSENESVKNLNNTFQYQTDKYKASHPKNNVHHEFPKITKKKAQTIFYTSGEETESFLNTALENVENKNFKNPFFSELHITSEKPTNQCSASFNTFKEVTKLTEIGIKSIDNQRVKMAFEEENSSDSDDFIASQIIKSQKSPNDCVNNLEETQVKSSTINNVLNQKFQSTFLEENNSYLSLDFIETINTPDSISKIDRTKKIFKEDVKSAGTNSSLNQRYEKDITPLTQTKDLNAFVPESSEDDNTPSDLEIILETPYINKKGTLDIKMESIKIKEETNSFNLNHLNQNESNNENEKSDTSYVFEIDDASGNDKPKNSVNLENERLLPNNSENYKKEVLSEKIKFSQENITQSSNSETPDLIIGSENILNKKQLKSDVVNQKFSLYEDENSDEIKIPNTQILEDTLIKIIEENNKENKKQSSCIPKAVLSEKEKINNSSKDLGSNYKDINVQLNLLKESPGKRISDSEISAKSIKKIKTDSDNINFNDEGVTKSEEEKILNFWQVQDIAQVIPKKSENPKYLLNSEKFIKADNLLSEELNSNNGFASNIIQNHTRANEKIKEDDSISNLTLLKKPFERKLGSGKRLKKVSLLEIPSGITYSTRVLRSVSKHYGTSIISQNNMASCCAKNLLKDFARSTVTENTSHTSKKSRRSKTFNNKCYFSSLSVNVVFTGFDSPCLDKIIQELGGSRIDDLKSGHVVVTDRVRRTVKFLCAIGLSLPIVSPDWLLLSKKENKFLNPWKFILKDEESEERWNFDLRSVLEKAQKKKFLQNFYVYATESVKPPRNDMLLIAECCGATPLTNHLENWPKKTLILTCEEDKGLWPSIKFKSIKILHFEFLLSGVLQQKIDFKTFQLR